MNLATSILGQTTVSRLREQGKAPVLEVGSDRFTRHDLAAVECFNFHAARLLTHVLRELQVPNLKFLFEKIPPRDLALPNVGVVCLAVLGAAFEAKGIGGETPLENYARKHAATNGKGQDPHVVTFDTLKNRQRQREQDEARERKRRLRRVG
ncbi:MAG TPA: hypothetical protein VKD72_23560 [Gemmataceae bacterium]|nr:hypothetical protein [Gemmataceae bacterium]